MSRESIGLSEQLAKYVLATSVVETAEQIALREHTAEMDQRSMQIAPEQGQFMQTLVRLIRAERYIEVGVFTGYSALAVALALPDSGSIKAFDISKEWTDVARSFWSRAGVAHKIDLNVGPASEGLSKLLDEEGEGVFDLAFIDADKENYSTYYEYCLELLRPGGVIMIDNIFWSGKVADPSEQDPETAAIRQLNHKVSGDSRVWSAMVPVGDGLYLVVKK